MENPFKKNSLKSLDNIPLSQSGIIYSDNSTNNLTVSNPFQDNYDSGAKVKKLSGYETQIEGDYIEQFDPLAQSAHFQDFSYKNNEVIVKPPIIETGNLQQNNFENTGNFDFLGAIKTENTNQIYENNITGLNYIQPSNLEQYITGQKNNSTDINNFSKNINIGNETESNSVKILPTIYADNNNISNILNQLKDNKDLNNDILYSKPIYTNPETENLNPFSDTGKLIPKSKNLNIENNILQPIITNIETGNLNIPGIISTPINSNFSTQNINADLPLVSNSTTYNNLQSNFILGAGVNSGEYSSNVNIGNEIIQNPFHEENANIFPLSGKQEGIIQAENKNLMTPNSSIGHFISGKNIVDNDFLLNNVIPKQNTVLPNTTNIPYDINNQQLKEEILKPIYINKVNNAIPFTENIISTNSLSFPYQTNNNNTNNQNLNINQSQNFDINQSQNINISNTYPINPSLKTSNEYQLSNDNININNNLPVDELRKKYRTEIEIVPVEEIEYIPVKKLKYVKKIKVYVPKVKKVIIPKKIVVPIKKTIYVTKPQNNNIYSTSNTPITLPTRTFYNNNTSIINETSNNIPYTNTSFHLPYSYNSNPLPYSTTSYQLPYTTSSNQLPYTTSSNQLPYAINSNQLPYNTSSNQLPYAINSNQLPYNTSSNQLPYNTSSNQLPYTTKSYSSNTEYDNDIIEHAIPLEEKEIESKMEEIRPIRYMSPIRTKSKYIPQSPNVSFNYSLNKNTNNSRFQSPLRKSYIYTGNIYSPRTYRARSLSSSRK